MPACINTLVFDVYSLRTRYNSYFLRGMKQNDELTASLEEMEVYFKRYEIQKPKVKCAKGHLIAKICTSEACSKPALHCSQQDCSVCSEAHDCCSTVWVKGINKMVKEKQMLQRPFYQKIFRINVEAIGRLRKWNEEMARRIAYGYLEDNLCNRLEQIFRNEHLDDSIRGKEGKQLYSKLQEKLQINKEDENTLLKKIEARTSQMTQQHQSFLTQIINSYLGGQSAKLEHEKEELSFQSEIFKNCLAQIYANSQKYSQNIKNIIPLFYNEQNDPDRTASDREHINFLREATYNPVRAELIFRASEHGFAAAKFHEKCDGVENTLTIVRTEFGKTIFAFAAPKWHSLDAYVNDKTGRSCLVLLDSKKKATLTQPQYSIYGHRNYGPRFGGGHDLVICDSCDRINESCCNFPYSYNCNGEFTNNQSAHTTICGAPNGCKFKVVDYEVHRLIYK